MPGRHAAISDLPAPGGPTISRLCPPAAAISSARLATSCPLTCARSAIRRGCSTSPGRGGGSSALPLKWLSSDRRSGAASTSTSPAQAASGPCATGQISPRSSTARVQRGEQHARRGGDAAVEAEFADHDIGRQRFGIDDPHRAEQRERDRQVVMRAFLGQVGGRQVDRDELGRQREADRGDRGAHPLAAFADRLVGQADDDEARQAGGDLALHFDPARLEPQIGDGGNDRDHQCPLFVLVPFGGKAGHGRVAFCTGSDVGESAA